LAKSNLRLLFLGIGVFALDKLTKLLAWLMLRESITLIPGCFDLTFAHNEGAAFSLLSEHPLFLTILSTLATGIIVYWFFLIDKREYWSRFSFVLILGGAIGNLTDRYLFGSVIDFLDFYVGRYHWPTFNIADTAICVGIGIFLFCSFFVYNDQPEAPESTQEEV